MNPFALSGGPGPLYEPSVYETERAVVPRPIGGRRPSTSCTRRVSGVYNSGAPDFALSSSVGPAGVAQGLQPRRFPENSPNGGPSGGSHQRGPPGGPFVGGGQLDHLLCSIVLAKNDRSRLSALQTLEANCEYLLYDTQRLHAAFVVLDAVVCNCSSFRFKGRGRGGNVRRKGAAGETAEGKDKQTQQQQQQQQQGAPGGGTQPQTGGGPPDGGPTEGPLEPHTDEGGNTLHAAEATAAAAAAALAAATEADLTGASAAPPQSGSLKPLSGLQQQQQQQQEQQQQQQQQQVTSSRASIDSSSPGSPPPSRSDLSASPDPPAPAANSSSKKNSNSNSNSSSSRSSRSSKRSWGYPLPRGLETKETLSPLDAGIFFPRPFSVLSRLLSLQTWVSIATTINCLLVSPQWLQRLVGLLHALAASNTAAAPQPIRSYACICLEELELTFPGLLSPFLGSDGFGDPSTVTGVGPLQFGSAASWGVPPGGPSGCPPISPLGAPDGPFFLTDIVQREATWGAADAPAMLLLRCIRHYCEGTVCEGQLAREETQRRQLAANTLTQEDTSLDTQDAVSSSFPPAPTEGDEQELGSWLKTGTQDALSMQGAPWGHPGGTMGHVQGTFPGNLHYTIPFVGVSPVPLPAITLTGSSSSCSSTNCCCSSSSSTDGYMRPPRLLRPLTVSLKNTLSLVLDGVWGYGDWAQLSLCMHLAFFSRWYLALQQHPRFAAAFAATSPSIFCPSAADPPEVKEQLLQALLLHCSKSSRGPPSNLFDVCGVLYEFRSVQRAPEVHALVFRFLLRSILKPQLATPQLHKFLCEHLRCHPVELGPSVLLLLHHASRAAATAAAAASAAPPGAAGAEAAVPMSCVCQSLLLPLAHFLHTLEPAEDLVCFSPILFELSVHPAIDPQHLLPILTRLSFAAAAADNGDRHRSWLAALCLLTATKQVTAAAVLTHITLLPSLKVALLTPGGEKLVPLVERYLSHVSPPQHRFNGFVPFLSLFKSTKERRLLCGLQDEQSAFFLTPRGPLEGAPDTFLWEGGLGAPQASHSTTQEETLYEEKETAYFQAVYDEVHGEAAIEALTYGGAPKVLEVPCEGFGGPYGSLRAPSAVEAYYDFVASHSFSVCLPFRLRALAPPNGGPCNPLGPEVCQGPPYGTSIQVATQGDCPAAGGPHKPFWLSTLYAVELFFSRSPSYQPLSSVCIPFLQCPLWGPQGRGPTGGPQDETGGPLTDKEEEILRKAAEDAFPFDYEIILKLEPIEPEPTVFSVETHFTDSRGTTYTGSLSPFSVSFQDLFLPICAPPPFRAILFNAIWTRPDVAKSVKTLDVEREVVLQMIEMSLKPFLISNYLPDETEEFDFSRDNSMQEAKEEGSPTGSCRPFCMGAPPLGVSNLSGGPTDSPPAGVREHSGIEERQQQTPAAGDSAAAETTAEAARDAAAAAGDAAAAAGDAAAAAGDAAATEEEEEPFYPQYEEVFVDQYFEGQVPYEEILEGCKGPPTTNEWGAPSGGPPPRGPPIDTLHALIFLPPRYHLLFKFNVANKTTIVRCATDRWEALGYLEAFFSKTFALALAARGAPKQGAPKQGAPIDGRGPVEGAPTDGRGPVEGASREGRSPVEGACGDGAGPAEGAPGEVGAPVGGSPLLSFEQ
ncbi:hypothetical protein, conserved [Eimeria maxima]|uniref:AP5B1 C-terminal domain-containing protein n=1 Tax=Eimeria maxima TaxID=5804 RepID=U6M4Z2_EIMMA|nr:hypothetical protein, conserved [Eimeria maxima]CDJ56750.1 hypothetical protein, conserved [Eimeria maxima]